MTHGCKVVVVRYGDNGMDNWLLNDIIRVFRDRAVAIGREKGATICDIASIVEKDPKRTQLYLPSTGVHVTEEGVELTSNALLSTILKIKK